MAIRFSFLKDEDAQDDIEIAVRAAEGNELAQALFFEMQTLAEQMTYGWTFMERYGVNPEYIILLMRDGRYVTVKTTNAEYTIRGALIHIEKELNSTWFVRISQSEIINMRYVKSWNLVGDGCRQIELENNIVCYVSRRYVTQIRDKLRKGRNGQ